MFSFLNDPTVIYAMTLIAFTLVAIVSMTIAIIIFSFQGKNFMDWTLAFKNFAMSLVVIRIIYNLATNAEGSEVSRFLIWSFLALAYLLALVALLREHVFYKNRNIIKAVHKQQELD